MKPTNKTNSTDKPIKPTNQPNRFQNQQTNKTNQTVLKTVFKTILLFFLSSFLFLPSAVFALDFDGSLKSATITDSSGTNTPPSAAISHTIVSEDPFIVDFDASGSTDTDGAVTEYKWDFGDGITASGVTVSHQYGSVGKYPVTLTVTDDKGGLALTQLILAGSGHILCIDPFGAVAACDFETIPNASLSKNADRTNVSKWMPDTNGTMSRVKVWFGTPNSGSWADCDAVTAVVYKGIDVVGTASITPANQSWVWSDYLVAKPGYSLDFDTTEEISFGIAVDVPESAPPTVKYGIFSDSTSSPYYYRSAYLPPGESWGIYSNTCLAVILEYMTE